MMSTASYRNLNTFRKLGVHMSCEWVDSIYSSYLAKVMKQFSGFLGIFDKSMNYMPLRRTYEVHAYEMHTHKVYACETHTHEKHAHNMHAHETHPRDMRPMR
jgi:hypothetical protein